MSGFLRHLASRAIGAPAAVRPVIRARYDQGGELAPGNGASSVAMETLGERRSESAASGSAGPRSLGSAPSRPAGEAVAVAAPAAPQARRPPRADDAARLARRLEATPPELAAARGPAAGASAEHAEGTDRLPPAAAEEELAHRPDGAAATRTETGVSAAAVEVRSSLLPELRRLVAPPAMSREASRAAHLDLVLTPAPTHVAVSIGRIEVRLVAPAPAAPAARRAAAAPQPCLTLDGYLAPRRARSASGEPGAWR